MLSVIGLGVRRLPSGTIHSVCFHLQRQTLSILLQFEATAFTQGCKGGDSFAYNVLPLPSHDDAAKVTVSQIVDVRHDPRIMRLLTRA